MHKLRRATLNNPSSCITRQQWQRARREVQRTTRTIQNEWWTKKAQEIQSFADKNDMHNFYNDVKTVYGSVNRCITPLKTADGLTVLKDQNSILLRFGCPNKFVNILRQFHDGMTAQVTIGGQESAPFPVHTGVRQGCVLAPVLFNIYLLCVTKLLHKEIEDSSGLQSVLAEAVRAYSRMGLTINTTKTEVICQWSANIPSTLPSFTVADEQLSVVPSFRYPGSILSDDTSIDNEVQNRIKQASAAFGRLRRRVFQNKNLHLRTKVCVYQAICITTLLYSCEAWVTYSHHIKSLEHLHIGCLQCILGITCRDRVPHSEILVKTNCRSIEAMITQHQLRRLGHVIRMPQNHLPRRMLYGQLHHGRGSAGGQKKRYKDQLKTALRKCKIRPEDLEDVAADRNTWRQMCLDGTHLQEEERTARRQQRRLRRNTPMVSATTTTTYTCPAFNRTCGSRIGRFSHQSTHRQKWTSSSDSMDNHKQAIQPCMM
ncbi:hypothetical protein SKAU_G00278190 [Synaphobranchus kaupii]|uniref:Reverse transcriptase domain-containing protein n=1 Tax=Synaphobranchus kaupii TaxID=118154 RepID=A0A9Q1INR7_SYNKA|nr:hypothetical protein SKAU_G00278190 [Synaphobranchus kaupii]